MHVKIGTQLRWEVCGFRKKSVIFEPFQAGPVTHKSSSGAEAAGIGPEAGSPQSGREKSGV